MLRIGIAFFVLLFLGSTVAGQKSFQPKQVDFEWKGIVYRNEYSGNVTLHTNGYSIAYNSGKIKTYYKTNYYHVELGYMSDPREQKQNKNIPLSLIKYLNLLNLENKISYICSEQEKAPKDF